MDIKTTNSFQSAGTEKTERQICPECGSTMTIMEQHREFGDLFIWYECTKNNCDGQWLRKSS